MVSKTPDEEPALDIMLTQTQALGSTANVFYSKRNEKFGVSLYGSGHYQHCSGKSAFICRFFFPAQGR